MMRRFLMMLAVLSLVLAGCSAPADKQADSTEGQNLEQEQTQSEDQGAVENGDLTEPKEESAETADLHDEAALKDYFYQYFSKSADNGFNSDEDFIKSNLQFVYADFDNDGTEDVVCFSDGPKYAFDQFLFVGLEEGAYRVIETKMEPVFASSQKFYKEGDFVIRELTGGGTGIGETYLELSCVEDGKIIYTGTSLIKDGYVSIPPSEKNPDGISITYSSEIMDMSYKVGTDDDRWLMFQYKYFETDDFTGEVVSAKEEIYTFNAEKMNYYVDLLSESAKTGTQGNAAVNEAGVYELKNLKPGQTLEGFDVEEAYYVEEDRAGYKLVGEAVLEGTITVDEMYDEYIFTSDQALLEHPVRLSIDGMDFDTDRPGGAYFDPAALDMLSDLDRTYLKDQQSLAVRVTITSYANAVKFYSEGGQAIEIKTIESLQNVDPNYGNSEHYESTDGDKLVQFAPEMFTTASQGELQLDYSKYRLAVLPMFDSMNTDQLGETYVAFEGAYINQLKFTVMGRLEDVKINNYVAMGDEGEWEYLGDVENAIVSIDANLPNDMSGVKVYGKFYDGEGMYLDVEFALDNMRALEEYKIILIE